MKAMLKVAFITASLFAASAVLGQTKQAPMNVLIGNATTNDTQAEVNDKFAELLTKYSDGRLKASVRHGESLGGNAQMLAALQAGSLQGMIYPSGFMSTQVTELALFDLPFLLPGAPGGITAFAAQSKAAARMMNLAEQKGIHVLGFHGIGAQSLLTRFPVNKLADIQGKKFRIIPSPPRVGAYQDCHRAFHVRLGGHCQQAVVRSAAQGPSGRGNQGRQGHDSLGRRRLHQIAE